MQITFTGANPYFLEQSFLDPDGNLSIEISSVSPTEIILTQTFYTDANVSVTLNGTGFAVSPSGLITSGVITSAEFDGLGIRQATITDINWQANALQVALFDIGFASDFTGIASLFNSSGPITLDASGGRTGFDLENGWTSILPLLTQPIDFIGSPFDDTIEGSSGNDTISTGGNFENGDYVVATEGNDQITFDTPIDGTAAGFWLYYDSIEAPIDFEIDGLANTGSINGPGFTDTLINTSDALEFFLGLEGSRTGDTFEVELDSEQVVAVSGNLGSDIYDITTDGGVVVLDFDYSAATSGLELDLAAGTIADDGFGFTESFTITGTPDRTIIWGTPNGDRVLDGPGDQLLQFYEGDDVFIASNDGQDSVNGGNGTDLVRFDDIDEGNLTIRFDGGLSLLSDRTDPENSMLVLSVEDIQTSGGTVFELDKHDGIGLISAADLTTLTELYIAYFDRAADALGLSFWATAFQKNGFTFQEIADLFFTQPETVALYSGVSDGDFVTSVYQNVFGRNPDQDGLNFWTGQLASGGTTESGFILDFLAGARAATGSPDDVAYIESKTDLGLYFAVIQGQSNLTAANAVMDAFDGTAGSLTSARDLSDTAFLDAQASNTELLLPVVGVIDAPFADVA